MFKHWSAFILISGILVCWQSVAQAQQPFSDTTSATRDFAEYIRTVQLINNDILAVGRISDSLNTGQLEVLFQYLEPDPQRHFIVKGNLPGQHFATNAFVLPWGVGVTGVFSSSFAYPTQGFLMLYDMFSDTVYVSYYSGSNVLRPFKLSDGCYLDQKLYLVGEQPMSSALNAMDETVLLIADFNGNVLQTRRMGQLGATQGGGRIKIGSSNRLMIGYYQITFQPVLKHQIRIDEVSLDGTLQRFHLSADSLRLFGPYDFNRTHDGGLAYIGLLNPNGRGQQAYLAKLNPQWQTRPVWAYTMGDTTHSFVPNALVEDSSGHFLMAGYYKKDSTIGGTTYYKQQGMLAKVNRYGELVWDRQFLPFDTLSNQRATINDIRITNSGYALAGSVYDYPQTLAKAGYAWILQIDSFGCLIPGCAVSVAETKMNQVSLKVWPNPASELLYVNYKSIQPQKSTEIRLNDMQGRIRFQNKSAEPEVQYILPVHALEAGVYVLQLIQDGRLVAFEKVVVGR